MKPTDTPTTQTVREKLENMKLYCPDCPIPHNISSKAIDAIIDLIVAEAQGMKKERMEYIQGPYGYGSIPLDEYKYLDALDDLCHRLKGKSHE